MSETAGYTRRDVAYLLSLTHDEAIEATFPIGSSMSDDGQSHGFSLEGSEVPLIARWVEVQRAKLAIQDNKKHLALTQLHLQGYTEGEIANGLGLSQRTVNRRWRATLQEIMDVLGGEAEPVRLALDHIDMCLRCGVRPRARISRVRRTWTANGWRWRRVTVPAGICAECIPPDAPVRRIAASRA